MLHRYHRNEPAHQSLRRLVITATRTVYAMDDSVRPELQSSRNIVHMRSCLFTSAL